MFFFNYDQRIHRKRRRALSREIWRCHWIARGTTSWNRGAFSQGRENCRGEIASYGVSKGPMEVPHKTIWTCWMQRAVKLNQLNPVSQERSSLSPFLSLSSMLISQELQLAKEGRKGSFSFTLTLDFLSDLTPKGEGKSMKFKAHGRFANHIKMDNLTTKWN